MTSGELLADCIERIRASMHAAVEGLDAQQLAFRPDVLANPIGWLLWHTARIQDDHIAGLQGGEQLYVSEDWASRMGLQPDDADIGYGHDAAQVARSTPADGEVALAYLDAVSRRSIEYLRTLDEGSLARVVDDNWDPPVTEAVRLVSIINDNMQHTGQAAYIRGLIDRG
ncbi:MAG: mycothiol transferase [Euzebya sp.]